MTAAPVQVSRPMADLCLICRIFRFLLNNRDPIWPNTNLNQYHYVLCFSKRIGRQVQLEDYESFPRSLSIYLEVDGRMSPASLKIDLRQALNRVLKQFSWAQVPKKLSLAPPTRATDHLPSNTGNDSCLAQLFASTPKMQCLLWSHQPGGPSTSLDPGFPICVFQTHRAIRYITTRNPDYITLSHRWLPDRMPLLLQRNLPDLERGFN